MTTEVKDKPTYEQFLEEWLAEIEEANLPPFDKGLRFAEKLVTQWLGVTADDEDFHICDGSGDGGIDIAYLQRADSDLDSQSTESIGDTWYLVQSKYGTAFSGAETILNEGMKVISTLQGQNTHLSTDSQQLLQKLNLFRQQASEADRIVLVFATTAPIAQDDRRMLDHIKLAGRQYVTPNFDVEEVSLKTVWEALPDVESQKRSVAVKGQFIEQYSGLLVGTISLIDLFDFLKLYQNRTGNLDQLYERNVRQFLGNRRKINKGIKCTLNKTPEKFGLYNNGITIVVSSYSRSGTDDTVIMNDPYVVNGCQTTRTIWQVLDVKLNSGGTGSDTIAEEWKERAKRGGVVTKIVSSDEAEITNITRFTNSQNSVREQDFIALNSGFQGWAREMSSSFEIFLEIQRGGIESRKAYEKQHPALGKHVDYVNAFDLIKVYGAGWLEAPGLAFGKNAPFLPKGSMYGRIISRPETEEPFGVQDLYAAYVIKRIADNIGFGRNATQPSRRQSRFLFYHVILRMLSNVILLTPALQSPSVTESVLTAAVLKLNAAGANEQLRMLSNGAIAVVDEYLTVGSANSAHNETSFTEIHNGDLNGFLKSENLGKGSHSPLLVQLLSIHNAAFTHSGGREKVAEALAQ